MIQNMHVNSSKGKIFKEVLLMLTKELLSLIHKKVTHNERKLDIISTSSISFNKVLINHA